MAHSFVSADNAPEVNIVPMLRMLKGARGEVNFKRLWNIRSLKWGWQSLGFPPPLGTNTEVYVRKTN